LLTQRLGYHLCGLNNCVGLEGGSPNNSFKRDIGTALETLDLTLWMLAIVCALNGNIAYEIECSKGINISKPMANPMGEMPL
jgi:hypothetical protein